jgi:hypothetical protein
MRRFAGLGALSLATILACGCDSGSLSPPPDAAQAHTTQPENTKGSRGAAKKKKKEPGVGKSTTSIQPRANL